MSSNATQPLRSLLYQRFNGVMLGLFTQQASLRTVRDRFPVLREQVVRFLEEMGADWPIPDEPDAFGAARSDLFGAVMGLGPEWAQFKVAMGLGYMFGGAVSGSDPAAQESMATGLDALGVEATLVAELAADVERDDEGRTEFDSMMTAGLRLAKGVVEPCREESELCFVAMPFSPPFPTRYHHHYRRLLANHDLVAIRAWGGMGNEAHHPLLISVLSRCGWCLAELTDSNPNVTYELGFATARGIATLAVMDTNPDLWVSWASPGDVRKLSNLRGLAVMPYDSSVTGWETDFVDGVGADYLSAAKRLYGEAGFSGAAGGGLRGFLRRLRSRP